MIVKKICINTKEWDNHMDKIITPEMVDRELANAYAVSEMLYEINKNEFVMHQISTIKNQEKIISNQTEILKNRQEIENNGFGR